MGLLSFIKDAGEKLFGTAPTNEESIKSYISKQGFDASGLTIAYDAATSKVTVGGTVPDQATREKIVLCCGNVHGVATVNDNLVVAQPAAESQWYSVVSGDTLSKIASQFYHDPAKYPLIFEANKPMLSSADKIYPGQNLRIPAR